MADASQHFKTISYYGHTVILDTTVLSQKMIDKLEQGRWEPETFATLKEFLDSETVYLDIGGWVGVLPFWAARIARRVIAVDPDPVCIQAMENVRAHNSGEVTLINAALSGEPSVTIRAMKCFGSSETSIIAAGTGPTLNVPGICLAALLENAGEQPVFIKIDIEGYEYCIDEELKAVQGGAVKGVQMAVHPQIHEGSLEGSFLVRRCKTFLRTLALKDAIPGFRPYSGFTGAMKFHLYLFFSILLRVRPKGTDLVFRRG